MGENRVEDNKVISKLRENVKAMSGYRAGKSIEDVIKKYNLNKIIKLSSNENPYGASPRALSVLRRFKNLHVYPREIGELIDKISEYLNVDRKRIVIGAGIDGILENMFKMFVNPGDEVIIPVPTFPYYHTLSDIFNAKEVRIRRRSDFKIDEETLINSISDKTKIIFICSPNNPTGNTEDLKTVKSIVENSECLVFIDEAYAEFSSKNLLKMLDYENVVIARTFSKAFGLANLRIGYAVMDEDLAKVYRKVNPPFSVSTIAMLMALESLRDIDYMLKCVRKIKAERERVYRKLLKMNIKVYPSEANFLFFKSPIRSSELVDELMKRGVIVRDCSCFIGCDEFSVRVSIGKRNENNMFLNALRDVINQNA